MPLLEIEDLSAGYANVPVLHGVSLQVSEGEIAAVVGPNGAGKTTLVKAIFGLVRINGGALRWRGHDLVGAREGRHAALRMGCVPQVGSTFPQLTIEDNLRASALILPRAERRAAVSRMLERFPALEKRRRSRAAMLSGGERQMLAIAGALVTEPEFLVLDEPTTGLAPIIVQGLIDEIRQLRDRGTTVLWIIEEDPVQCLKHADRAYLFEAGSVSEEIAAKDLLESEETLRRVFFGVQDGSTPAA